jgi:hypothetical protein
MEEIIYKFIDYKIRKIENELSVLSKNFVFLLLSSINQDILLLKELRSYYVDVLVDRMEFISTKVDNYFHMLEVQKMKEEIHNRIVQLTVEIESECDCSSKIEKSGMESFIQEKELINQEIKVLDKFGANKREIDDLKYLFEGISMSLERLNSKIYMFDMFDVYNKMKKF